jgi:VWFA-related protein
MRMSAAIDASRRISNALLASLNPARDDAALFTFDTRLLVLQDFTRDLRKVRLQLDDLQPWGSTSLFDAVAGSAAIVSKRTANRRAVVVLTDGLDTTSAYSPTEVSAIASSVDVPIYVFALAPPRSAQDVEATVRHGALADLAAWTGGTLFVAGTEAALAAGINQLVEELRHQYVIAFAAAPDGGWRSVQLKARRKGLTVRTRAWYLSGSGD